MQKKKEKVPSIARFARTFILHVFSYVPYLYLSIYVYVCYHLLACVFSNCMFCFFSHFSSISITPCRLMLHPSRLFCRFSYLVSRFVRQCLIIPSLVRRVASSDMISLSLSTNCLSFSISLFFTGIPYLCLILSLS